MNVIGHGIDIENIDRTKFLLDDPDGHFIKRCFTTLEQDECRNSVNPAASYTARFAAKEAVMKALEEGFGDGVAFTDVEILKKPSGAPGVVLHKQLAKIANSKSITGWLVSISHTEDVAIASVLATSS